MRNQRHPLFSSRVFRSVSRFASTTGVIVACGVSCLTFWQLVSAASIGAFILDSLMPLTALATLGALFWLFIMIDAGNRGEDANAARARGLATPANTSVNNANLVVDTQLPSWRAALLEANETDVAASVARLSDDHVRLKRALDVAFSSTELSYHRYCSLADSITEHAAIRIETWLKTPHRASQRSHILDELDAAASALDVAATEVADLATSTRPGGLAEAARELAELAARAPRLAGH